jgi:hypothetical protein
LENGKQSILQIRVCVSDHPETVLVSVKAHDTSSGLLT